MKIGYARVSTKGQSCETQVKLLREHGCDIIYEEMISGSKAKNSKLEHEILPMLKEGDELVVTKFDRLGRSTRHFMSTVQSLKDRKIKLRSLHEQFDQDSPFGEFFLTLIAYMNEWEMMWIRERTRNALVIAREKHGCMGRPKGSISPETQRNMKLAWHLKVTEGMKFKEVATLLKVKDQTAMKWVWLERKRRREDAERENSLNFPAPSVTHEKQ